MSTPGPDESPPQTPDELGGLDPKDLFNAGLETMPPVTLPPQPADPDATVQVSGPRPSQPTTPHLELPLPADLTQMLPAGAYRVESFLGQGGMGAVYKGVQVRLKRPVAIKIMRRDLGKDYDFEARFEREAQAMAKLNHPNIVSVIDFGEAGPNYLYIVMELIDGADMMDVIRTGRMTQEMALTLLPQICDALQFAHDHGIVHRDIKPSNIMLTRDGRIKMADFGLAKRYDVESSFRTQTGTGMGTPDYAAPEQFDPNAPIDHRADIYALGVMIYQMITGQLPRGVWKPPSQRAEIDPHWDDIVGRAMQSDPGDRYQQASEIKTDVSSIPLPESGRSRQAAEVAAPTTPQPRALASTPTKSRAPLLFGLITGTLVLALGAFFALRPVGDNVRSPAAVGDKVTSPAAVGDDVRSPSSKTGASGTEPKSNERQRLVTSSPTKSEPLPESGWKPLVSQTEWQKYSKGATDYHGKQVTSLREFKDGLLHMTSSTLNSTQASSDGAIRARLVMRAGSDGGLVTARASAKGRYSFGMSGKGTMVALSHYPAGGSSMEELGRYRFPKPLQPDEKFTIELRLQGDQLTGLFNGQEVVRATDQRLKEAGKWGIDASDAWFESVEVQPLPAAAPPAPIAPAALPESGWKQLFTETEWKAKPGFKNGLLNLSHALTTKPQSWNDGAIRARIEYLDGTQTPSLVARQTGGGDGFYYRLGVGSDGKHIYLSHLTLKLDGSPDILGRYFLSAPLKPHDKLLLELRVQGDRLVGLLDGKVIIETQDTRLQAPGEWGIIADEGWFESVEVQPHPAEVAGIKLWDTPEKLPKKKGLSWENGALRLDATTISYSNTTSRDVAFRATALVGSDQAGGVSLFIHHIPQKGNYALSLNGNAAEIRAAASGQPTRVLAKWPLTRSYRSDEWIRLEIRAEGTRLTALVDGQILGSVEDRTLTETDRAQGGVSITVVRTGYFKDIEYVPQDAPAVSPSPNLPDPARNASRSDAGGSKSSDPKFPPGQWVKVFTKPEELPANMRKPDSGVKWDNGWIRFAVGKAQRLHILDSLTNYGIRTKILRQGEEYQNKHLFVRAEHSGSATGYSLVLDANTLAALKFEDGASLPSFWNVKPPAVRVPAVGEEYTLEWACVGSKLVARYGTDFVQVTTDASFATGGGFITGGEPIRDIEVINLDGLPEAEALRLLGVDEQGNDLRGKTGAAATSATPTPVWRDALAEAPLKKVIATANHTDKGYLLPPGNHWEFPAQPVRAGAIRVLAVTEAGSPNHLSLNFGLPGTRDHYQVFFRRKLNECGLSYLKEGLPERRLALKKGVTPADGEPHELLLARIADQFYFLLNGEVILQAAEPDPTARYLTLNCFGDTRARVQKVEYLNLDGVSETEALRLLGVDEQRNDLRGK